MSPQDDEYPDGHESPMAAASRDEDRKNEPEPIRDGSALCLSGGGYRAMLFHLGALLRLNETGQLSKLKLISSVSGGSITSGVLGLHWKRLHFVDGVATNLIQEVIEPVREMARHTIDAESVIGGILSPFSTIGDHISKKYREILFGDATLQDLPDESGPLFVINATNVQSGALWRFSRPFMGDYKVGRAFNPAFSLAEAVGASSAFPPILSPVKVDLSSYEVRPDEHTSLNKAPYTKTAYLSDGGVYDNMGLQTAWRSRKTLFVSDAGAAFQPEEKPASDWARHSIRILNVIDNQVRSLRKSALIDALREKTLHDGAYWGIGTDFDELATFELQCPRGSVNDLAGTPTRLAALDDRYQERLINWGYAISAAILKKHYPAGSGAAVQFPFAGGI